MKNDTPNMVSGANEPSHAFLRECLSYSEKCFAHEMDRRSYLERKSQIYLAILVLLLGILPLKGNGFRILGVSLISPETHFYVRLLIYIEVAGFFLSILTTVFSIVLVLNLKVYPRPYPRALSTFLFSTNFKSPNIDNIMYAESRRHALATEIWRENNAGKSKWLRRTSWSMFSVVLFLTLLLVTTMAINGRGA